jgi:hypothetical protein
MVERFSVAGFWITVQLDETTTFRALNYQPDETVLHFSAQN